MEDFVDFIERKICIGAITSTEFLRKTRDAWNPRWMEADGCRLVTSWCAEYFDQHNCAPGRDIELIYTEKLKNGLRKDQGERIEIILGSLSEEYISKGAPSEEIDVLIAQTCEYFETRQLKLLVEDAAFELDKGNKGLAEEMVTGYSPLIVDDSSTIDPFSEAVRPDIKRAFAEREKPLIHFPGALGDFWNDEFVRGGFVAFMGHEKIGKTFLLMETAFRGIRSGNKVAFFQAGDMTKEQQLMRFGIYLSGRSDRAKYCNAMLVPVLDCLHHQLDICEKNIREKCDHVLFENQEDITLDNLRDAAELFPNHSPCYNCNSIVGTPWLKKRAGCQPLKWTEAYMELRKMGRKYGSVFRLSTHPNETLSLRMIRGYLEDWEKREGFVPDIVIIDYADILAPDADFGRMEFRHQQDRLWRRLRRISEEGKLVVTATQTAATGYDKKLLSLKDFSEDKRKHAHVTAMYGLNQTEKEKEFGIMRINALDVREGEFNPKKPVTVLQRLQMGRPILDSFK